MNEEEIKYYLNFLDHSVFDIRAFTPRKTSLKNKVSEVKSLQYENEILKFCEQYEQRANIYAGILPKNGGRSKEHVTQLDKLWIELDCEKGPDDSSPKEFLRKAHQLATQIIEEHSEWGQPLLVMSGNGFHLIWEVNSIELDDLKRPVVDAKLKTFTKYFQDKYKVPNVEIDPAVADLARILKIPGTTSVKGDEDNWREAKISKKPEQTDEQKQKLKEFFVNLDHESYQEESERQIDKKLSDKDLKKLIENDENISRLYYASYPEGKRSEPEFYLVMELLKHKLSDEQIDKVMNSCSIGKWRTETQHYKDRTIERAQQKLDTEWKEQLKEGIQNFTNYVEMVEQFYEIQPIYYDKAKLWWMWNFKKSCWEQVDEIDIMNAIDEALKVPVQTTKSHVKNEILECFKRVGRKRKPKPIPLNYVQLKNGIVDVETGETMEATPEYFTVNPIDWELGEEIETPTIDKLFHDWVGEEYVQTLYEIMAYCMLPNYPIHRVFCLNGSGSNGKSKFLSLIEKFIGKSNCCSSELDNLSTNRFEASALYKKLVCTMGETDYGSMKRTQMLKKLTGQDLISFEFKGKDSISDYNYAKILISTNSLPITHDKTKGFYRRWLIIDFPNEFKEGPDVLKQIPEEEYNNLASKCILLLPDLLKKATFHNEGSLEDRIKKYENISNPIKRFIREQLTEDVDSKVPFFEFYERFENFCKEHGYRNMGKSEVSSMVRAEGYEVKTAKFTKYNGETSTAVHVFGMKWRSYEQEVTTKVEKLVKLLSDLQDKNGEEGVSKEEIEQSAGLGDSFDKVFNASKREGFIFQLPNGNWKVL